MQEYIDALENGKILSVDWSSIEEMLGENPKRKHTCSICEPEITFPPSSIKTTTFTEEEICTLLNLAEVCFMSDLHQDNIPWKPIKVRYFSCVKPEVGLWMERPNHK